ncbi:MAG TPA: DUF2889 domain-containing protein [Rhodocyclaceae bacterium]|uniref:DUF2889 domain-containing protein n=1 Tax=Zoogloea sp. TaxID=49181 RepID=UPI002B7F808F|nr:DUF2889 domain-containing protein [Zoogloea sp.]HMV18583.1 DUF2889 domain-containing protein [Rhodocyclaceae bacterium]HMV64211.1 DUF2889 domain-containing protein [Rhodocyclaceae bacterium]HMW53714.1 DUF2889 domain-containing protein [Rhodocyclaceae bacterium]HMY49936.1 DUF2889 domain-containing protein [Rhodocyclaceae bacterium]HMZ76525.1 DUF2889 domain-containing protein [Rhodocyclaceae bacterium]
MSLPPSSAARRRVHARRIEIEGFLREDGLLDLDARLTDVKDQDYVIASGLRKAGEPIHDLFLRVTIDTQFNIVGACAVSARVPYPGGCETITPAYRQLVGLNLVKGFRKTVGEMFADVRGCSHLSELLLSLPTAAIQTLATFRRDTEDTDGKPFQLDRCHALETTTQTVLRYYPRWYRSGD